MQEKVLVLDIDGTLTNSKKEITEATKQGIWNILQHGHKVILASGRPTPGMRKCEEELELKKYGGYLLSFNGARIVECKTGEVVYQRTLPLSIVPGLYEFAKANGCGLITYQGPGVISAFEPDDYVQLEARINGIPIKVVDNFVEYVNFDINKCLMTAPEEIAPELEKQLQEKYSDVASIYRTLFHRDHAERCEQSHLFGSYAGRHGTDQRECDLLRGRLQRHLHDRICGNRRSNGECPAGGQGCGGLYHRHQR